jgi:carbonic anhydrase
MSHDRRLSRRSFLAAGAAAGLAAGFDGHLVGGPAGRPEGWPGGGETLRRLLEGNRRFAAAEGTAARERSSPADRARLAAGQTPWAAVVACADSRVAPELLFDQGLGRLFVVRVAGNVVAAPAVEGSLEYAAEELGVPLVLVVGHSGCGAVQATLKHLDDGDAPPGAIGGLVALIKPATARTKGLPGDRLDNAVRANIGAGVERLRGLWPVLAPRVKDGRLKVAGATYDLRSGLVTVLPWDGPAGPGQAPRLSERIKS